MISNYVRSWPLKKSELVVGTPIVKATDRRAQTKLTSFFLLMETSLHGRFDTPNLKLNYGNIALALFLPSFLYEKIWVMFILLS